MNHFFDVGANVGQTFTDYLNLHDEFDGWDVWCFEPSPRHLPALMEAAKYQSTRYNIHVCPYGIRGFGGIERFYLKDDPRGDSFEQYLASDHETNNTDNGYQIHVACQGIIGAINGALKDADEIVIKLDCEGSEYSILTMLLKCPPLLNRISRIMVEWHKINNPIRSSQELTEAFSIAGKPLLQWTL